MNAANLSLFFVYGHKVIVTDFSELQFFELLRPCESSSIFSNYSILILLRNNKCRETADEQMCSKFMYISLPSCIELILKKHSCYAW